MNIINNTGWLRKRPAREVSPFGLGFWDELFEPLALLKDEEVKFSPKIDLKETDKEITVKAELPGMTQDQVTVNLTDDALVIKGEKTEEKEKRDEKNVRYYAERRYGSFQRVIPVSAEIEHDKIDASFRNGILTVTLPKSTKAKEKVKTVSIRSE